MQELCGDFPTGDLKYEIAITSARVERFAASAKFESSTGILARISVPPLKPACSQRKNTRTVSTFAEQYKQLWIAVCGTRKG